MALSGVTPTWPRGTPCGYRAIFGPGRGPREEFNSDLNSTRAPLTKRCHYLTVRYPSGCRQSTGTSFIRHRPDEQNKGVYFVNPGKMCDVTDQMITTKASVQAIVRESAGYLPGACRRPTKEGAKIFNKMPLKETLIVTATAEARPTGAGRGYIPDGHRRNWDRSLRGCPQGSKGSTFFRRAQQEHGYSAAPYTEYPPSKLWPATLLDIQDVLLPVTFLYADWSRVAVNHGFVPLKHFLDIQEVHSYSRRVLDIQEVLQSVSWIGALSGCNSSCSSLKPSRWAGTTPPAYPPPIGSIPEWEPVKQLGVSTNRKTSDRRDARNRTCAEPGHPACDTSVLSTTPKVPDH
ncbi:hypothetical protein Bbelb_099120 [Branchiostoma belcheri]|nr:hypothetical protein Bbelb_099120 [Branchiostoma belcheri]